MDKKTKAKILVIIGLIPAIVPIMAVFWIFIYCLFYHLAGGMPHTPYVIFPLGLIFPILYGVALIRKKLDTAIKISSIWCVGWFLSCVLVWIVEGLGFDAMGCCLAPLELILILPIRLPLTPFIDTFSAVEYTLVVRVINGAVFMVLLLIGITGLILIEQAEIQQGTGNR